MRFSVVRKWFTVLLLVGVLGLVVNQYVPLAKMWPGNQKQTGILRTKKQQQREFTIFTNQVFQNELEEDALSLHFLMKNPEVFGTISNSQILPEVSEESQKQDIVQSENWLATLKTFDYHKLTREQKIIYDSLTWIWQLRKKEADYVNYRSFLCPVRGLQAQLPILLQEYRLENEEDVENYFLVLQAVPGYLTQLAEYEEQKMVKNIPLNQEALKEIRTQCNDIVAQQEDYFLITGFEARIQNLGFSSEEQTSLTQRNKEYILETVFPAYENLVKAISTLLDKQKDINTDSGTQKKQTKAFEIQMQQQTGTDLSLAKMQQQVMKSIEQNKEEMALLIQEDTTLYDQTKSIKYPCEKPEDTIQYLQEKCKNEFPELSEPVDTKVNYVEECLQEHVSPAFYLTPPLDDWQTQTIYLNNNPAYDLSKAFSTLAHESYPGHLYQTVYFRQLNKTPIRNILGPTGYTEGWGTYAEIEGFAFAGLSEKLTRLMQVNSTLTLMLYAGADLKVNVEGISMKQLYTWLSEYGYTKSACKEIYQSVAKEPGSYLPYAIGYLQFVKLRELAQSELKNRFRIKEFHKVVLETGPVPFPVLTKRIQEWTKEINNK